jgi:hypothetical protein
MAHADLAAILPLALGHDQEVSASPWVRLSSRTAYYPSRVAQAALAVAAGTVPITPDLVDLLYLYDDVGICRAASILPGPPDLARALWSVRASLVAAGAVPEVTALTATLMEHGNVYGDISQALASREPGDDGTDVLFVPGAGTLFHTPDAAINALKVTRTVEGRANIDADLLDSGHVLRELGLADEANEAREKLQRRIAERNYRLIVAGTPKEAFGLREALVGLPVEVHSVGGLIAEAANDGRLTLVDPPGDFQVVFHPSETLLHRLDEFAAIDQWLTRWLGPRYQRESDPRRTAWPAAIERPNVRMLVRSSLLLAEARLAQLEAVVSPEPSSGDGLVLLTCDPFSWQALTALTQRPFDVTDLASFVVRLLNNGDASDD